MEPMTEISSRPQQSDHDDIAIARASESSMAHERLGVALDRLHATVARLEDMLEPVLDPSQLLKADTTPETKPASALANMLNARANSTEEAAARLERLLGRLDLP